MFHIRILCLALVTGWLMTTPAAAWPTETLPQIFRDARQTLPAPLQQLLVDMEPVLHEACMPASPAEAAQRAIDQFSSTAGDLLSAVAALRDAGCAAAALNDPELDALVRSHQSRFAVVFYGWHPALQDRDLDGYLEARQAEVATLAARFERTSELPNRSDMIELSPEFGLASVAYSHAVTDVANVWLYIWTSANGGY
jgi:hypothetical protein